MPTLDGVASPVLAIQRGELLRSQP
jgi:hypothetical protein